MPKPIWHSTPTVELPMDIRSLRILIENGYEYAGQFMQMKDSEILALPGAGKITARRVRHFINSGEFEGYAQD